MRNASLGTTGIEVTEFFFGAGSIGGIGSSSATRDFGLSPEEGLFRLEEATDLGIRVIDTADSYGGGQSEQTVGQWVKERQLAEVLIATKTGMVSHPDGSRTVDLSGPRIEQQIVRSTQRLGHLDLYLSHAPDPNTPLAETLAVFSAAQQDGRIRAYGVSNVTSDLLEQVLATADRSGLHRPGWVQNRLNLLDRGDETDLIPLLQREGLGYTPFSPLAGGVLSDRYLDGAEAEPGSRIAVVGTTYYQGFHTPENLTKVANLRTLAQQRAVSVSGLALAWLRNHPAVTAPIVAPSKPAQWRAVREALEVDLDAAEHEQIGALFA